VSITSTIKTPQQFVITRTTAIIVMGISTVAMVIPQAAYANNDKGNPSSSDDDDEDCASDELPASINGKIRCIGQGECYSEDFEFNGKEKEVEHCNFMMSTE
jgi:hypothetical protein